MNDIVNIKSIIKEFAEKYSFIQETDIENIESTDFNREKYIKIDNKPFISLNEYTKKTQIVFGKINISIDTINEDELYYIDMKNCFVIDIVDYSNPERLLEEIIKECKNYKLI